jgi:nicotinamidase/pyrazinamidase
MAMQLESFSLGRHDALIIVDLQNDFLPGGALGVPDGDAVIAPLNACIAKFSQAGAPIFATRDWHPADHCSFRARGGPWPPHCIADTRGAAFAAKLMLPKDVIVISKASSADADAYSGFDHTELATQLAARGCRRAFIAGLATDYCVRATALDAMRAGLQTVVLEDGVRAVNVKPTDGESALAELQAQGARLARSAELRTQ